MVIKTESTKASVLITRKGACGGEGCSKCSGCEHQTQVIECANYISAKVGDRVQISGCLLYTSDAADDVYQV